MSPGSRTCLQVYLKHKTLPAYRCRLLEMHESRPASACLDARTKPRRNGNSKLVQWPHGGFGRDMEVHAIDTHNNPYLNGLKLDISIFDSKNVSDGALISTSVRTVLELKSRVSWLTIFSFSLSYQPYSESRPLNRGNFEEIS